VGRHIHRPINHVYEPARGSPTDPRRWPSRAYRPPPPPKPLLVRSHLPPLLCTAFARHTVPEAEPSAAPPPTQVD
jgi:hypothetical protein